MKHVKRFIPLLLIALLLLAILPSETYASPPQGDTHRHNWKVIENKKPTCTKGGKKTWECTLCGKKYTEKSRPLGHDPQPVAGKAPTCTETGLTDGVACGRCGEVLTPQETIPALGHQPETIPGKSPTCTETGLTDGQKCTRCGTVLKAQETIPALGHQLETIPGKAATCTETGLTDGQTCTRCGAILKAQETIPALGHQPETIPGKAATCTETGLTDGQKCARCGAVLKAQEAIPALDHDWDEGTITVPPWLLTAGERTFTCKRDPSHTRAEEIPPSADAVFASLSTGSWTLTSIPPLIITEQPVGGAVTRYGDDTHLLHVAASGGQGAYTYEWKYRPNANSTVGNIISWMFLHSSGEQNEPDYEVADGDMRYWCIVKDEAGNTAQSNTAIVDYKISIAKQPDNVNLQSSGNHTLTCEAMDGSGEYLYTWRTPGDSIHDIGQTVPVSEPGEYFCRVMDNVTGDTVDSEMCTVYDVEPFHLVNITQSCEILPNEDTFVVASFAGGVEDYEIWWDKNGTAIDSVEGRDELDNVYSRANVDGAGKYTVHGVDSMYATASGSVTITVPKLTIVEQPKDSIIPKGSYTRINVVVADGEMPYTYILYRNGEEYLTETDDDDSCPVGIWDPGEYYYHIEDSQGRQVDSDAVIFEDAVFRITDQTESGSISKLGDKVTLSVEAEGGVEPYTYLWSYKQFNARYKVGDTQTYSADKPGEYMCRVVDADGEMIHSKAIQIGYTGDVPFITSQPESGILKGGTFYLSCNAVSGSGGELRFDWEVTPTGVRPSWSNVSRSGGSYKNIDATVPGTYRCKVTDTKTGKYVYTKAAFVTGELTASVESYVLSPHMGYDADNIMCTFNITGGAAPYTMKVYIVYAAYHSDKGVEPSRTVLWETHTVNTIGEAKDFKCQVPRTYYYPYYDDGQWKNGLGYLKSYAIITDADGRTTRVEIIE